MGFFSSNKTTNSSSTYTPNVPDWYKNMLSSNMSKAEDLSNRTSDEGVAGFTDDQNKSFDLIRSVIGQGNTNYDTALNSVSNLLSSSSGSDYKKFMNPYQQEVTDAATRKLVETADAQKQNIRGQAAMSDAFGGGRSDLMLSQVDKNLNQQVLDNNYKGLSDAFTWANDMALKDKTNTLNAASTLSNLTGQQQNYNLNDANALNKIGTQQQQQNQAGLDYSQNQTSWFQNLLNQMPTSIYGGTTNSSTTTPTAGWGSQLLGAGLSAAALASGNPMLMMGGTSGLSSLFGGGSGGTDTGLSSPTGNLQMGTLFNQAGLSSASGFANGGIVQKFADGGFVQRLLENMGNVPQLRNSPTLKSLLIDKIIKGNNVEDSTYEPSTRAGKVGKFYTDMVDTVASLPSMSIQGLGMLGKAGYNYMTEDVKAAEAAKAAQLAQKQKEEQARAQDDAIRAKMEQEAAKQATQTPVQETVAKDINPVVETTQDAMNGGSSNELLKSLISSSSKDKTPSSESGVNVPLLLAGLGMMSSDKPFAQAVGEGGTLGAVQYAKEREAQKTREAEADKYMKQMLIDLEKQRQDKEYKDASIKVRQQTANAYDKQVNTKAAEDKELKTQILDLQKQRDLLNKQLVAEVIPSNKTKLQQEVQGLQSRIDELLKMNKGNVAQNVDSSVQSNEPPTYDW